MPAEVSEGRRRVVIENVQPQVDCGQFPVKRTVGERVFVSADAFTDGHDGVVCELLVRPAGRDWQRLPMRQLMNDRWEAEFSVAELGECRYTIEGWIDRFGTWHRDLKKRLEAQQCTPVDLAIGAELVGEALERANAEDRTPLAAWRKRLEGGQTSGNIAAEIDELAQCMARYPDRRFATRYAPELRLWVERERARFSAWYEMFPRSTSTTSGRHGTFDDCIGRLPYIAELGFDVLYLPPIHPIGLTHRKGRNNARSCAPGEPGSPWAIGGADGGHKAILGDLGTLADFERLVQAAAAHGIELALDIAFQCSPDHPYVAAHPAWFRQRPDGSVQYAENPPKKYEDIYPFDFESSDWRGLWDELLDVFLFWIGNGIKIFRVDNPHTKAFGFWEWLIGQVKQQHPETIFLSEAFTRPKLMYRLAKLGFTQSYTYFTWRNGKSEFIEYFTELTRSGVQEFFRPNLWPNTPDILPEHLQHGGQAAFTARFVLAATLSSNFGIYGPTFELQEHVARDPGSEEYLDSEKYEIRHWDLDRAGSLRGLLSCVNRARRENPALQSNESLRFHEVSNDRLLCYSKRAAEPHNLVVVVVNLDFYGTQNGWIRLPLGELGIAGDRPYRVRDLISGATFTWQGERNFVELDPQKSPAHLFHVEQ